MLFAIRARDPIGEGPEARVRGGREGQVGSAVAALESNYSEVALLPHKCRW